MAVSIHAPREGCDGRNVPSQESQETVSIHAPREGCDSSFNMLDNVRSGFNSRTPGGVRRDLRRKHTSEIGFNSRTPGGVRPCGGDYNSIAGRFQFTHPGRGATS